MVLVLSLLVLVVHNVGYMLSASFWTDEAWVAVTTRYPLSALRATTASTPIGWSFLLRLVTFGQSESGRLLPLAFAAAAVAVAYWLVRRMDWKRREIAILAGVLGAVAVLIVPAMLVRDDLKQYTADTFLTLVLLALTSRLERRWSWSGLLLLSLATWGGMLLSDAGVFAGAAAWLAIWLVQLFRGAWRRLGQTTLVAGCSGALGLAIYVSFDAGAIHGLMIQRYGFFFMPVQQGLMPSIRFLGALFGLDRVWFGLGHYWFAVPLIIAGLITLFRLGRPAVALAVFLIWPEMVVLSVLKKYPFLDLRTSTFMFASAALVAAIGVAGICAVLREKLHGSRVPQVAAISVAVLAVAGFSVNAGPYVRSKPIPPSSMQQIAQYVAAHSAPRDPIFLSADSSWGFAYYWPTGQPGRYLTTTTEQGYQSDFPAQPRIVVARQRTGPSIEAGMRRALAQVKPGTCGRLWMVLTQISPVEAQAIPVDLHALHLTRNYVLPGLYYINVGPSSCPS